MQNRNGFEQKIVKMFRFDPKILIFFFVVCRKPDTAYHYENILVGGPCEIKFYTSSEGTGKKVLNQIDVELKRLDSLLNYFSPHSLVSLINREHQAVIPSDIRDIFVLSDSISRLTDGLFDISIAPLLEIWGFYKGEKRVPSKQEIKSVKVFVDYRKVTVKGDTIIIRDSMKIDLGGIAQGYAADRVTSILKEHKIKSAIINIAGEIVAIGNSPRNRPWTVGIKNPRGEGIIEKVFLSNKALSTSGDYEKFFLVNNIRYAHILNPKTGYPAEDYASVTIFSENAGFADGLATAVSVMGAEKGKKFLDSMGIAGIIYYEKDGRLERLESE